MKTYKNLINAALSDEIMNQALEAASQKKKDRPEVQRVIKNRDWLKGKLRELILGNKLKPIIHKARLINDGFKQKVRVIIQPYFTVKSPEQWLQHIVIRTLQPIFMKGMYKFSCGSVPGVVFITVKNILKNL